MTWLLVLQLSTAAAGYAVPDRTHTPGTVHLMTAERVCALSGQWDERMVTTAMKRRVGTAYGIAEADWPRYRFDHLVNRAIGGADIDENLWPQPVAQSRVKDRVENWLDRAVCDGRVSLEEARRAMASDWRIAYEVYVGPLPVLQP